MKQLDRLLFEQGNDCFFCGKELAKADASVEHLQAVANGGTNAEENVVACCKAINGLLGSKPLKEKFAIILRQKAGFRCPAEKAAAKPQPSSPKFPAPSVAATPAPLKLAASKPSPSTVRPAREVMGVAKQAATALPGTRLLQTTFVTCPTCKSAVASVMGQTDYVCSRCRGAFRY